MNDRRATDPRIAKLVDDVAELQADVKKNTEITEQVREILISMRTLASLAKWLAAIAAAFATVFGAIKAGQNLFTNR